VRAHPSVVQAVGWRALRGCGAACAGGRIPLPPISGWCTSTACPVTLMQVPRPLAHARMHPHKDTHHTLPHAATGVPGRERGVHCGVGAPPGPPKGCCRRRWAAVCVHLLLCIGNGRACLCSGARMHCMHVLNETASSSQLTSLPHARASCASAQLVDAMAGQVHPTVQQWIADSHSDDVATRMCTTNIGHVK